MKTINKNTVLSAVTTSGIEPNFTVAPLSTMLHHFNKGGLDTIEIKEDTLQFNFTDGHSKIIDTGLLALDLLANGTNELPLAGLENGILRRYYFEPLAIIPKSFEKTAADRKTSENLAYLQSPEVYLQSKMVAPNLPELYTRLTSFNDKNTKADLFSFVQQLASEIVSHEALVTYGEMLEKESTVRALEKFGFTFGPNSHAVTKDGRHIYKGTISYDDRRTYMKEIALVAINQKAIPKENPETLEITYEVTFELA